MSVFLSDTKCELDITQAIKMPPMPGQSRSLLHFTPTTQIKREIDAVNVDAIKQEKADSIDGGNVVTTAAVGSTGTVKVTLDHVSCLSHILLIAITFSAS